MITVAPFLLPAIKKITGIDEVEISPSDNPQHVTSLHTFKKHLFFRDVDYWSEQRWPIFICKIRDFGFQFLIEPKVKRFFYKNGWEDRIDHSQLVSEAVSLINEGVNITPYKSPVIEAVREIECDPRLPMSGWDVRYRVGEHRYAEFVFAAARPSREDIMQKILNHNPYYAAVDAKT